MGLVVETRDGFLWATVTGRISMGEAAQGLKNIFDTAAEHKVPRILIDCHGAEVALTDQERYEIASSLLEYSLKKDLPFRVAIVGTSPTVNGLGAWVASLFGATAEAFSELKDAVDWLNRFSYEGQRLAQ